MEETGIFTFGGLLFWVFAWLATALYPRRKATSSFFAAKVLPIFLRLRGRVTAEEGALLKKLLIFDMMNGLRAIQEDCHMVHHDLKPDNIFVGSDGIAKIGDFGLAKSSLEKSGSKLDLQTTREYAAPEFSGQTHAHNETITVTHKSDTFALGLILYELEKGELRFYENPNSNSGTARKSRDEWFTNHNGIAGEGFSTGSETTDELINALTHKDPEKRITMSEALEMDYFSNLPKWDSEDMARLRQKLVSIM